MCHRIPHRIPSYSPYSPVKVRENWLDDPERYRAMGLEFPKG